MAHKIGEWKSPRRINLIGRKFGALIVVRDNGLGRTPRGQVYRLWRCKCICGNVTLVRTGSLRSGHTRSCGCLKIAETIARSTKHGEGGRSIRTPEYICWKVMRQRCSETSSRNDRRYYFDAGVRVCKRWSKYKNFIADMGRKPSPRHSIDRVNPYGDYKPSNCRWATPLQQRHNRRSNTKGSSQ